MAGKSFRVIIIIIMSNNYHCKCGIFHPFLEHFCDSKVNGYASNGYGCGYGAAPPQQSYAPPASQYAVHRTAPM